MDGSGFLFLLNHEKVYRNGCSLPYLLKPVVSNSKIQELGWGEICLWAPAEVYPNIGEPELKEGKQTVEVLQAVSAQ